MHNSRCKYTYRNCYQSFQEDSMQDRHRILVD